MGRRVLEHLLVSILLLWGIVKNWLINSRVVLVSLVRNVLLIIRSISLMKLLVCVLLRLKLLIISIWIYHLVHILVQLWRRVPFFSNHVAQLRGELDLLLILQIEFRSNSMYLLISKSKLLRGLNLHTVDTQSLIWLVFSLVFEICVHRAGRGGSRESSVIFELDCELSLAITDIVLVKVVVEVVAWVLSVAYLLVRLLILLLSIPLSLHVLKNVRVL